MQYPDPLQYFPGTDPVQVVEMYSYTAAGTAGGSLPSAKRVQVNQSYYYYGQNHAETANLDMTFSYNSEGGTTAMTYPSTISGTTTTAGPSYNYSYDAMYRLSGMKDASNNTIVSNVSYNPANQLLTMNYPGVAETRGYNSLNQLTSLNGLTYNYPAGANNGKISSATISGETVTYTYDSLNRLATANGSSGWGESYGFDPFGNLLSKTVTAGSAPSGQWVVDANNHLGSVDANGNTTITYAGTQEVALGYDVENRLSGASNVNGNPFSFDYAYDAQNHRILSWAGAKDSNNNPINYTINIYTPSGQKLGAYRVSGSFQLVYPYYFMQVALSSSDQYFGGRRLAPMDQLGSNGSYFPWGEDKGGQSPQDTYNFATYWRDSASGLDYAQNRYYSNAYGRFMTPDPHASNIGGAGNPRDPHGRKLRRPVRV